MTMMMMMTTMKTGLLTPTEMLAYHELCRQLAFHIADISEEGVVSHNK
jgi:hypothetical protein